MTRFIIYATAIGLLGCSSKPLDREQASKNLKSQADEVRRAMLDGDHPRLADLTHPSLVDKLGGKARFVERVESLTADLKERGFRFVSLTLSEPSQLVEAAGDVYAIVPFTLEMTGAGGLPSSKPSYLIGASRDGGSTWKFIDGSGVAGNREMLRQVLPDFPASLPLPSDQDRPARP